MKINFKSFEEGTKGAGVNVRAGTQGLEIKDGFKG